MQQSEQFFSNKQLKQMIIPLFIEQFLLMLVGLVDTIVAQLSRQKSEIFIMN